MKACLHTCLIAANDRWLWSQTVRSTVNRDINTSRPIRSAGPTKSDKHIPRVAVSPLCQSTRGGLVVAQYIDELYRSPETRVKPDPDHLFQKTKEIFLSGGLHEIEHLQFREAKLKKLCLDKLWRMTKEQNPSHPRLQPEPDPDTENYDWSEPPLIEPQISRERLEEEVTSWYVRNKAAANNQARENSHKTIAKNDNLPSSDADEAKANQYRLKFNSKQNSQASSKHKKKHWRAIQCSEPEGPNLDSRQLRTEIASQLENQGSSHEPLETFIKALSNAQQKASRAHRKEEVELPIKLAKNSSLFLHNYAWSAREKRAEVNRQHSGE